MFNHSEYLFKKILFMLTALPLLFGAIDARGDDHNPIGIVTTAEVAVRSKPGSQGFLQKTLKRGTEIKIIERRGGWLKIYHNDEVGFIRDLNPSVKIVPGRNAKTGNETSKQLGDRQSQIDALHKHKKHVSREIEKGRQDVAAFTRRESDIIKRLDQVELTLNTSRKRAADLKSEIEKLEHMLDEASTASEELRKRIQANEEYVFRRLVALYKINRLGKFHLPASAESMNEFIQRKAALERILAYDEKIRRDLVKNQAELKKTLKWLDAHRALKSVHAAEYQKQTRLMSQERSTRTKLLADIRKQKALELAAIDALTRAADELERKIKLLISEKIEAIPHKNASQLSFPAHKGLLIMPVNGKIINLFGPYKNPKYNIINFRSGIDIKADHGEPIRSVFKGKAIYSSWFKGYGNMIIIDHGNSYYTVYAHMEETFISKGDEVDAGEVIATVGDTGSMTGAKLYFEVRHHGKPMNPLKWLKKG
jgi:murein DD-endopeptidase MepM/ murein hydrolase activator NlpD